jgi:hypothetical protein
LLIVSPDSLGTACPLSGRNSTYRPVQISAAGSHFLREAVRLCGFGMLRLLSSAAMARSEVTHVARSAFMVGGGVKGRFKDSFPASDPVRSIAASLF